MCFYTWSFLLTIKFLYIFFNTCIYVSWLKEPYKYLFHYIPLSIHTSFTTYKYLFQYIQIPLSLHGRQGKKAFVIGYWVPHISLSTAFRRGSVPIEQIVHYISYVLCQVCVARRAGACAVFEYIRIHKNTCFIPYKYVFEYIRVRVWVHKSTCLST